MYESPIEAICKGMRSEFENNCYKVIQDYGIVVDKEELIKALQYDRNQYEKGYADGLLHMAGEWISVEDDDKPKNESERVQVYLSDNIITKNIGFPKIDTDRFVDGKWVRWGRHVTHWKPLPEPPKGANRKIEKTQTCKGNTGGNL